MECPDCAYLRRSARRAGITSGKPQTCERCYTDKIAHVTNLTPKKEQQWKRKK